MKVSKFVEAQEKMITLFKGMAQEFNIIKQMQAPLIERWQMFLGLVLPVQLKIIKECGFDSDQSGLTLYNEQLMALSEKNSELFAKNKEKWDLLFKEAFDISSYKELTLEKTKDLIAEISKEMVNEDFLMEIEKFSSKINPSIPLLIKQKELLSIIFPLQTKIMAKHGLNGDEGYIAAQKALMEYYYDPFIKEQAAISQKILFERAKFS